MALSVVESHGASRKVSRTSCLCSCFDRHLKPNTVMFWKPRPPAASPALSPPGRLGEDLCDDQMLPRADCLPPSPYLSFLCQSCPLPGSVSGIHPVPMVSVNSLRVRPCTRLLTWLPIPCADCLPASQTSHYRQNDPYRTRAPCCTDKCEHSC